MTTTSSSVKASATAFIESKGVDANTPFDIVSAMEEAFIKGPLTLPAARRTTRDQILESVNEVLSPLDQFVQSRMLANARWKQRMMIFNNFGKWLEKDEKIIMSRAKDGLEAIDDRLAAGYYAVEQIKSRKAWKIEQKRNQDASHHGEAVRSAKIMINGKAQWDNAQVHELPPAAKDGKGHVPAYYAIKLPDGTIVSLGKSVEGFAAKTNRYPSQAMQNIAERLGIKMRGGDTAILNHLLNTEQLVTTNDKGETEPNWKWLPSYTSVWQGKWIVYVGWRLNPKVAASSYWLDANGELTRSNPNDGLEPDHESYQAPLTLSQLDYHLLSESSDLEVQDEAGEVVDFMNEEEEFLTMFPQRESEETFLDYSKYCDDDDEVTLFNACSAVIDRSEGGITLGDLESSQFVDGYLHKGILRTKANLMKMELIVDPDEKTMEMIEGLKAHLARLKNLDELWNRFIGVPKTDELVRYWYPNQKQRMFCMSRENHAKMIPEIIEGAYESPLNLIEAPLAREVEEMPEHRSVTFTWLTALSPKLMAKREREARKSSVLQAVKDGTLKAQLAFSSAFEEALRA